MLLGNFANALIVPICTNLAIQFDLNMRLVFGIAYGKEGFIVLSIEIIHISRIVPNYR